MTAPEGHLDVLDPRFPKRLDMPASCFWELARLRPDRAALAGLTGRARADEARDQERFIAPQPRWVPERAHEETAEDMGLAAGWWRGSLPREGMPQPEDTDVFISVSDQAAADEQAAAERRPVRRARRAVMRLVAITKGSQHRQDYPSREDTEVWIKTGVWPGYEAEATAEAVRDA